MQTKNAVIVGLLVLNIASVLLVGTLYTSSLEQNTSLSLEHDELAAEYDALNSSYTKALTRIKSMNATIVKLRTEMITLYKKLSESQQGTHVEEEPSTANNTVEAFITLSKTEFAATEDITGLVTVSVNGVNTRCTVSFFVRGPKSLKAGWPQWTGEFTLANPFRGPGDYDVGIVEILARSGEVLYENQDGGFAVSARVV